MPSRYFKLPLADNPNNAKTRTPKKVLKRVDVDERHEQRHQDDGSGSPVQGPNFDNIADLAANDGLAVHVEVEVFPCMVTSVDETISQTEVRPPMSVVRSVQSLLDFSFVLLPVSGQNVDVHDRSNDEANQYQHEQENEHMHILSLFLKQFAISEVMFGYVFEHCPTSNRGSNQKKDDADEPHVGKLPIQSVDDGSKKGRDILLDKVSKNFETDGNTDEAQGNNPSRSCHSGMRCFMVVLRRGVFVASGARRGSGGGAASSCGSRFCGKAEPSPSRRNCQLYRMRVMDMKNQGSNRHCRQSQCQPPSRLFPH
mmetsp:Transcript_1451/g.3281  ORF Transcript_1451/g.3281 Transcript_1451/m.3281 type:complete len:312 (-) Transcript_1451:12-947(-)